MHDRVFGVVYCENSASLSDLTSLPTNLFPPTNLLEGIVTSPNYSYDSAGMHNRGYVTCVHF
jgi:hypothetical protein